MLLMVYPLIAEVVDTPKPRYNLPASLIWFIGSPEVCPVADGKDSTSVLEGVLIVIATLNINGVRAFGSLWSRFAEGEWPLVKHVLYET